MNQFLERIATEGVTPALLEDMISAHEDEANRLKKNYDRYAAKKEAIPIHNRKRVDYSEILPESESSIIQRIDDKVNNALYHPFDVDIIDTKVGYFAGVPINYEYDDRKDRRKEPKNSVNTPVADKVDEFTLLNHAENEDSELSKMSTVTGLGARLAYIDREGRERIKNIDPWTVIFLGDSKQEPVYSARYYKNYSGEMEVEFYDNLNVSYFYTGNDKRLAFDKAIPHMFDYNPLYGLPNNDEELGDAERVYTLIDDFDRVVSDVSNEIEQYRLAYMVFRGLAADEDDMAEAKRTGILELMDEKDDVKYLTKDINDTMIQNHLERLEKNIMRLSKSVNFTDENFGTSVSGVALKYRIMGLENKCITFERKFTAMLRYQFKVLFSAWKKRMAIQEDDYLNVWFNFTRNLPLNITEEATALRDLKGVVSEKTRLSSSSLVDDVEFEIEEMERDRKRELATFPEYGGGNNDDDDAAIDRPLPGSEIGANGAGNTE